MPPLFACGVMARPTKYTEERAGRILQALSLGATHRLACQYAGIDEETFRQWRKRFFGFSDRVTEAEGRASVGWLAKIEQAASDGVWQAAAWKLERRYPHEYGRKVTELGNANGKPLVIRIEYDDDSHSASTPAPGADADHPGSEAL